MASNISRADAIAPIVTFVSMIVLGIIISEFIISNQKLQLPIILFSFFAGIVVAALELRVIINRRKMEKTVQKPKLSDEEKQNKLARYVADLFDEDIPFDEIEKNNNTDNDRNDTEK